MKGLLCLCFCLTVYCQLVAATPVELTDVEDEFIVDTPCTRSENGLTLKPLVIWLRSVTNEVSTTYLTPDSGATIFTGKSVRQADDAFLSGAPKNVKTLWMSNSLCSDGCAQKFMQKFQKTKIYLSHIYPSANTNSTLNCMAKMVRSGYKFSPIDWGTLASSMTKQCQYEIDKAVNKQPFLDAVNTLKKQLEDVQNRSNNPQVACN